MSKVMLIILDGIGHSERTEHNALLAAKKPNLDYYLNKFPHSLIETSGEAVGLPSGIMGNSEVGHLSIGSGRIIMQDITRINHFAEESGFESLPDVKRVYSEKQGALHLIGLLSDGGVHSDIEHLFKLVDSIRRSGVTKRVFIHAIMDGRDTPPKSGKMYLQKLEEKIASAPNVKIANIVGRFYIMDRDKRWDRVQTAYDALVNRGTEFSSVTEAIEDAYGAGETDEFVKPRAIRGGANIQADDQVIFFNFRSDRAREISMAFALPGFKEFNTTVKIKPENWLCFTRYREDFPFPILFSPQKHKKILGELISQRGLKQLRIAETEKYAHVTHFFNGGEEEVFPGEDRVLIPSPKDVKTYDQKPEMSAILVTDELEKKIQSSQYDFIVVNYANGDMVGHTGIESAAIRAVETVDQCLGRVVKAALEKGFEILITADHGNVEEMVNAGTGEPFTQHTTNPVPLIWIGEKAKRNELKNGILADIAPTILAILGWEKPDEMTGHSLIIDPRILMKC